MVEMTIPDKPDTCLQKYRLTEKGGQIVPVNANDDGTVDAPESSTALKKIPGLAAQNDD